MPLFKITTLSTFENVYQVGPETEAEAKDIVKNESIDFFQKHLLESSIECVALDTFEGLNEELRKKGYF